MRVLVLGGYGLIGEAVVRALIEAGYVVAALGRDTAAARRRLPEVTWITADLANLQAPADWRAILAPAGVGAIVNCAGTLQDGLRDDVRRVQSAAMRALYDAAAGLGTLRLVQISASRATVDATTAFMRSKGEADAALAASALDWVILRPGLVLAPAAYGGSALLRALAAVPGLQPLAAATAPVQTVAVDEVAGAVLAALAGRIPTRRTYDLVEDAARPLAEVVALLRRWLGLAPAPTVQVPRLLLRCLARIGDGLRWLGWRPPLCTTALAELEAGIVGDPAPWREATGRALSPLPVTLSRLPSTVQERWFARCFVLKPIMTATLSLFWLASGLVALAETEAAAGVLTARGWQAGSASAVVIAGAAIDIALGVAILVRATSTRAAFGMIAVTLAYLAAGSVVAPDLWLDPLGPFVKALPSLTLALAALALADDR